MKILIFSGIGDWRRIFGPIAEQICLRIKTIAKCAITSFKTCSYRFFNVSASVPEFEKDVSPTNIAILLGRQSIVFPCSYRDFCF